jgi:hypothetical protein
MADAKTNWTTDDVANRFEEAASTARRLPPVRVQGYFTLWPTVVRSEWERMSADERPKMHFQPSPGEVEAMLEVMRWVQWLDVEQRHLVWMRAKRYGWREISIRFGCCSKTAQRRWTQSLQRVTEQLNSALKVRSSV